VILRIVVNRGGRHFARMRRGPDELIVMISEVYGLSFLSLSMSLS